MKVFRSVFVAEVVLTVFLNLAGLHEPSRWVFCYFGTCCILDQKVGMSHVWKTKYIYIIYGTFRIGFCMIIFQNVIDVI